MITFGKLKAALLSALIMLSFASCGKDGPVDPAKNGGNKGTETTTSEWTEIEHEGFTFKIRTKEVSTAAAQNAVAQMKLNLSEINKIIPEKALKVMKAHPIWMEKDLTDGAAWYHVSKEYLASQGYMTEKWQCVEICNYVNYYNWTRQNQPYMVLHELCHLYYNLGIENGYQNADIYNAWKHAKESGMYKGTAYRNNTTDPESKWNYTYTKDGAYCLNDQMEYFSEMCEAYWGENDYYPFNYEQLKTYDPQAFEVMVKIWGPRADKQ